MSDEKNTMAEFQDPLENYDPHEYADPLESVLNAEPVSILHSTPYASVPPDTSVREALARLAGLHIACLLIEQDGKLVGVFSARDVLNKVALEHDEVKDLPVSEVMTTDPVFVYDTDSTAATLCVMAVSGYRHVPVVNLSGDLVGIVSPQRVTEFLQDHFEPA